ncbi:adenylate/guanylate cyclase domain-containing protein [Bosea sp. (in: a-proteobacteria)]|uniref:adenylate/guanylate cyclase domain-containing protein n=1 Tax=Bosea sp. (in: a-proteobacteria) TaxID=1871050 RepID=UPI002735C767|nr:adenylate/guanylate cyclase domain-containing protein [Bosea sp. (in: a-proteobacteria)]MDP3257845.1 adenylate/guanylate cyclase domain-containing protein [Bosea sp. (in: a-proteobacteria)]
MAERRLRRWRPVVAGALVGFGLILLAVSAPPFWRETQREQVLDVVLEQIADWRSPGPSPRLAIVAIDAASLDAVGLWPWRRETLARLIAAVNSAKPAAIALDLLLAGEDTRSPAALARRLAAETGNAALAALAPTLEDGDRMLADAVGAGPVVLGWVIDPQGRDAVGAVPILTRPGVSLGSLWRERGASAPPASLAAAAAGSGTLSLPGDDDGVVRRVPLFVTVGDESRPGLALEAVRLAAGASGYLLSADPLRVTIGATTRALPPHGLLRLVPGGPSVPVIRAADLLRDGADATALAGAIVFIGGFAPELGALRASARDPLTPSSVLQAQAVHQIATGVMPVRPDWAYPVELGLALVVKSLAIAMARLWRPAIATAALLGLLALVVIGTGWLALRDLLLDPRTPMIAATFAFLATSLTAFSESRWREARLRRRFEQHLAPGVVERIVADPGSLKLSGERREVTALFTDIEGFTQTTREAGPEQLVAVLDGYFEGVTRIVGAHGGMVDKLVGDAVHALFNAPFDLEDHPRRALACAVAILDWTETYRATGLAAAIGLGRTRQGLETGIAIVGDVGVGAKLDYTAHGEAVNMAARLEALNKELGSSICVGPVAASRCDPALLRLLGTVELRGVGPVAVSTPI